MLTRRTIMTLVMAGLAAPAALAQHADLDVDAAAAPPEMPRRWMMEDALGNVVTNEDFSGKVVLVYFGYTGCPDVCPTSLSAVGEAMDKLGPRGENVVPLFVTVDPERDTAKLLREFTGFMHPRIVGLRGPRAYTDHMVKAFNARYEFHVPDPAFPNRYSIDHTASIAVVGPDGHLVKRFPHGTPPDQMTADLVALLDEVGL